MACSSSIHSSNRLSRHCQQHIRAAAYVTVKHAALAGCRWIIDWLDQRVPTFVEWLLWLMNQISLVLHVITVAINLGVIWVSGQALCQAL